MSMERARDKPEREDAMPGVHTMMMETQEREVCAVEHILQKHHNSSFITTSLTGCGNVEGCLMQRFGVSVVQVRVSNTSVKVHFKLGY